MSVSVCTSVYVCGVCLSAYMYLYTRHVPLCIHVYACMYSVYMCVCVCICIGQCLSGCLSICLWYMGCSYTRAHGCTWSPVVDMLYSKPSIR